MDDGLTNKIPCVTPVERNIYAAIDECKHVEKLPMSLGDALKALAADEVVKAAMPGEMYRLFDEYKTDEWENFMHTTTDWDAETYMDYLP